MANEATLFEHDDGRYAVGTGSPAFTIGDPAWHRVGPVDVSALTATAQPQADTAESEEVAALIVRDVAESEPADPEHPSTLCVRGEDLAIFIVNRLALTSPVAPEQIVAENFIGYLCRAWGETDLPSAELVADWDGVRRFMVREWLGEEDATDYDGTPTLPAIMEEIEGRDWRGEGEWHIEFEIGGVSVEQVFGTAITASPEAAPAAAQPMFFASAEQANALQDRPEDSEGGVYLPLRKTAAGKFTMPLYAAPTAATPAAPSAGVSPDDDLLVACITLNGTTLTVEANALADMFGTDDEQHTYELTFKRMTRAAFEALGEFNGF